MNQLQIDCLNKATTLCVRKEYSSRDIADKIMSWGCSPDETQEIITMLVEEDYINDRRYAGAYANDKLRFNKWGRIKIAYMLRSLNINEALIKEALARIDQGQYEQILKEEISKKRKTIRSNDKFELKAKLYRFAANRGFEPDVISKMLE